MINIEKIKRPIVKEYGFGFHKRNFVFFYIFPILLFIP